ncbi:hypothetical protein Hanom_Chr00s007991g01739491 [Helianthus anomalus]
MTSSIRSVIALSRSPGLLVAKTRTTSLDWSPVLKSSAFNALLWASLMCVLLRLHQRYHATVSKSNKPETVYEL